MPDQLQLRGGTTTEHNSFTGVAREVTVDTTKKTLVVHDNTTTGGTPLMKESGSNHAATVGIGVGGEDKITINADGHVDIASNLDCAAGLDVTGAITSTSDLTVAEKIIHADNTNTFVSFPAPNTVSVETGGSAALRVDSSQRLLIGTSTSRSVGGNTNKILQIEGTGAASGIAITRNSNTSTASMLSFGKSRSATNGGTTIVQDDDSLGRINFAGADDSDAISEAARIEAFVDGAPASNVMPGRLVFSTTSSGQGSSTERMTILSSGNCGIGTVQPDALLHLSGTSPFVRFTDTVDSSHHAHIGHTDSSVFIIDADADDNHTGSGINLKVDNEPVMFLKGFDGTNNGCVGIGTTNPTARIHVDNGGVGNVAFLKHSSSGIAVTLVLQNNRATGSISGEQISFLDDTGTQRGKITNNTSSTTYHTTSDYRLKENEVLISDGIERVKQLKPYKFNWKHLPNKIVDGFFAHEVENLVEDCVDGTKDKVVTKDDHDKGDYLDKKIGTEIHQMIDHSKLVPLLVAAVKELIGKVEALETA